MYLFSVTPGQCTASGTANTWLPFLSIKAGVRAIRIRDLQLVSSAPIFALIVRWTAVATSGGSSLSTLPALTIDGATPAFSAIYSTSGGLTAGKGGAVHGVLVAVNIGQDSTKDVLDSSGLSIEPSGLGSIDIYVMSPTASASFTPYVIVEESVEAAKASTSS